MTTKVKKPSADDLLMTAMQDALKGAIGDDLGREMTPPNKPEPKAAPTEPTEVEAPASSRSFATGILPDPAPKPAAKSKTLRKIGPYITHETGARLDRNILRLKEAGNKNDMSDIVEVGITKVLDMLEAGLNGDPTPDAYDLLDDAKDLLELMESRTDIPRDIASAASTLLAQIRAIG